MRHNETTAAEAYTRRVLPQLGGLYCAAHAMTGSRENAEVLLCTALSDYFAMNDVLSARASLRSGILREMKNRALSMRQEEKRAPEEDFAGLTISKDAQGRTESTPLLDSLTQLPAQTQRLLILKYGCQLPAHAIAQLLETEPEEVKRALREGESVRYTDIMGLENEVSYESVMAAIDEPMDKLATAIAEQVLETNGAAPSALFLAGGGSKLSGLKEKVSEKLNMDEKRVAIAGNNFAKSVYADSIKLDDPEYATPLGIAVSAGLGLLNDSYVVLLNGKPAKLFRSGVLTLRDILLMNGYTYSDILGRNGKSLVVTLNGQRIILRGEPSVPAALTVNEREAALSAVVHAGDSVSFVPARGGADAQRTLGELLPEFTGRVLVNNQDASPDTVLHSGDVILTLERAAESRADDQDAVGMTPSLTDDQDAERMMPSSGALEVELNGEPLSLPGKGNGLPYYMMDLLQFSGLDLDHLDGPVRLEVNGEECGFRYVIKPRDCVTICYA